MGDHSSVLDLSPAVLTAVNRLLTMMGPGKLVQLSELMREVTIETGYGDVKVIISQGAVQRLKAEKSYG